MGTVYQLPARPVPDTPRPDFAALAAIFPYVQAEAQAAEDRVRAQLALTSLDAGLTAILGLPR
jgi:hypothetical protein